MASGVGFPVQGLWIRSLGLGFRVWGSGLGCRVWGWGLGLGFWCLKFGSRDMTSMMDNPMEKKTGHETETGFTGIRVSKMWALGYSVLANQHYLRGLRILEGLIR